MIGALVLHRLHTATQSFSVFDMLDQIQIDMAHAVYAMGKEKVVKEFDVDIEFLGRQKTIRVSAASILEATNKVYVEKVRIVQAQKSAVDPSGLCEFLVEVDVDGERATTTIQCRNVYESIYNVSSSLLQVLAIREVGATQG